MFVVMGANGNVGSAVASTLLERGAAVTIVTHRPDHADAWLAKGAKTAVADVDDIGSLRTAFRQGRRAFLLNPPADPARDMDATERRTIANILAALDDSGVEKVVAASTYGAQPGECLGDLSTLWDLEEGLRRQAIPAAINRGAYYMTNWIALADAVRETGTLPSMFPANLTIPMVAPADLGKAAAERLLAPVDDIGVRQVEGPDRYTPKDVADAFAAALGRKVAVAVTPRDRWEATFREQGFSAPSARSFSRMFAASLDDGLELPEAPVRGEVTLQEFISANVKAA